ncbi:transcription-repair coupling factor [Peptococcaceae bacterium 1198_IL3148]
MSKMELQGLLQPLNETTEFASITNGLTRGFNQQMVFGLAGSQRALVMAGLIAMVSGPVLIVTAGEGEATALADDLSGLHLGREVMVFPVWQSMPLEVFSHSNDLVVQRLKVLEALTAGESPVVIAPIEALIRRLVPVDIFKAARRNIQVGQQLDLEDLQSFLVRHGYERFDLIEGAGQFSIRGGIIDIYPMTAPNPVRIELWDDEVDSIRTFDPVSQRSVENIKEIDIKPAREIVIGEADWSAGRERLSEEYKNHSKKLYKTASVDAQHQLTGQVETWLTKLEKPVYYEGLEQLLPFFYPRTVNLLDYLLPGVPVLVDDPLRIKEMVDNIQKERAATHADLLAKGKVLPSQYEIYLDWRQTLSKMEGRQGIYFSFLPRNPQFLKPHNVVNFNAKPMHSFLGNTEVLVDEIRQWKRKNHAVVLMVGNGQRARNLLETLKEYKVDAFYMSNLTKEVAPGNVVITEGSLSAGFEILAARLVVITEKEIFGQRKKVKTNQTRSERRMATKDDLNVDDYVVHVNHGIGRYLGITTLDIGDIQRDYLIIKYSGDDKVYVPTDQVGMLQRYMGNEGVVPKLSKLGGNEWNRAKNRVRNAVKEIAQDLIKLYAQRETLKGHAYGPDTVWQKEFEMSFPYEETPDQLRSIEEVKRDLERPRPMDRLLCGDVGYGKTEVALRAAFKVVNEGKQVAVLVPTTILAQQHYNTFRERFAQYPINIEMLSRFRTPKEQRQIIKGLESGTVDIVIGTHRLVSNDVKFKDLGLLVVDEEQRFGVTHKERLKQLRTTVDVLTLTATPIPRTLHMSLVGVRDTSLLETPPEDRFPIQTYVLEEDPVMIREAIRREISRGGQVFYVHNRIAELDDLANWIAALVPEAKLVVAHGQMKEDELEKTMLEFMDGAYDVLICTTIIETGLDISNANTLIIKDADKFGLAQLYQLRGRVGRTNRLAYAYFTFRRDKVLTEEAEKRLHAIREFTELGSGYKIALRDLEIRGAGNILGAEQHGHIAEVGFDLYCKMLEEEIRAAKGETKEASIETMVELPVDAYIPDKYISDSSQKVELYRRIAAVKDLEQIADLEEELIDRYGDLPSPVERLLMVARIKVLGSDLRLKSINRQRGMFNFVFDAQPPLDAAQLVALGETYRNRIKFNNTEDGFEIKYKAREVSQLDIRLLQDLYKLLEKLR